jgi:tRNA (guanine-N1)-methyltransferase
MHCAATIINGVVRLLPGTLGCSGSLEEESHASTLLEHPHYTRPANFRDMEVPEMLRSNYYAPANAAPTSTPAG